MKQAAAGTQGFQTSQEIRVSQAVRNRAVNGGTFDRLKKVNDLVGTWEGADPTKCYAGIVPIVNGTERYDLAMTTYDLTLPSVVDYSKSPDDGSVLNIDETARKVALAEIAKPGCTYDTLLDAVVAAFPNGGTFACIEYTARTKKGGQWKNCLLGFVAK